MLLPWHVYTNTCMLVQAVKFLDLVLAANRLISISVTEIFFWDLWLLKLSFRKKWTKHKWRVFKLSWQLVHFTIYSDKCASSSACLWLKFSVWKYYIVLPILYHSPHAPNLFDKQQTAIFAHADSASLFDKLYNFDLPTKHKSHLWSCFRPHFSITLKKLRK